MYIGTSLGGCLRSIMAGEVSKDDVLFIVTRTDCPTYEKFVDVVKKYHEQGNPYASNPDNYSLDLYDLDEVLGLGNYLWYEGKIHQCFYTNSLTTQHFSSRQNYLDLVKSILCF
jgi:hypothetical protein